MFALKTEYDEAHEQLRVPVDEPPRTVSAFLAKLYNMINDPATDHLIHWSPTHPSHFVIPSAKAFATQLLPLNFRHSNFTSFVRQLNMYGFRKYSDLEASVVAARLPDPSQRPWEVCKARAPREIFSPGSRKHAAPRQFEHAHLVRGKPHLLVYIKRKTTRHPAHGATRRLGGTTAPTTPGASDGGVGSDEDSPGPAPSAIVAAGMPARPAPATLVSSHDECETRLQVHLQANGELKRRLYEAEEQVSMMSQRLVTISQENNTLWREYIQANKKLREQEETTRRIVSFMNNVYGGAGPKDDVKGAASSMELLSSIIMAKRDTSIAESVPLLESDFVFQPMTSAVFGAFERSEADATATATATRAAKSPSAGAPSSAQQQPTPRQATPAAHMGSLARTTSIDWFLS